MVSLMFGRGMSIYSLQLRYSTIWSFLHSALRVPLQSSAGVRSKERYQKINVLS
jgi:hypothetical protein